MRVARLRKVTGYVPNTYRVPESVPSMELREGLLCGFDAVILSFFEDGDATEVGIDEADAIMETGQVAALFGENRTDGRANHGMPHAHDIHSRHALANIAVDALEVAKDGLFPISPVLFE